MRHLSPLDPMELWRHRELLSFLVWRDVTVRYKQTLLGASWAVIQPFMTMVVFSIFFGRLAKIPSDGVSYPLFCFAALVPWTAFATALTSGGESLVRSQTLITKVYFPRLLIPAAAVVTPCVDFLIAFLVLLAMMLVHGVMPGWEVLWLPLYIFLGGTTALGASLWMATLNVKYRDVRHALPFVVQFWMFASPIAYSLTLVPESYRPLYALNPMVSVIAGFRAALLGTPPPSVVIVAVSSLGALFLVVTGILFFLRWERGFADII